MMKEPAVTIIYTTSDYEGGHACARIYYYSHEVKQRPPEARSSFLGDESGFYEVYIRLREADEWMLSAVGYSLQNVLEKCPGLASHMATREARAWCRNNLVRHFYWKQASSSERGSDVDPPAVRAAMTSAEEAG